MINSGVQKYALFIVFSFFALIGIQSIPNEILYFSRIHHWVHLENFTIFKTLKHDFQMCGNKRITTTQELKNLYSIYSSVKEKKHIEILASNTRTFSNYKCLHLL
jgi:hypothetical protein